jgi:hypothetical protein
MTSLHISHTVRDFDEWLTTFNAFDDFRAANGVTSLTIRQGADDRNFVAIDLQVATTEQARTLLATLEREIWPASPLVDGTPTTHLLESVVGAAV